MTGDLHQIAFQFPLVPFFKQRRQFFRRPARPPAQQINTFGDQLHIGIFNAIMDHFHKMAGAVPFQRRAAGLSLRLGRRRKEQGRNHWPHLLGASRHDGRPVPGPFLAAGNPGPYKNDLLLPAPLCPVLGVLEIGVSSIDDHIPWLQQRQKAFQKPIHCLPSLDHQNDSPGPLQSAAQLFQGVKGMQILSFIPLQAFIGHLTGAVINPQTHTLFSQLLGQIPAHHTQADQPALTGFFPFHDHSPFPCSKRRYSSW